MQRRNFIKTSFALGAGFLALAATANAAQRVAVPRWQPHDFVFKSDVKAANPFNVDFMAEVRSPDGKTFRLPGFFEGDGSWKVRVSPTIEGAWSLVTKSDVKELDGKAATFTCIKSVGRNAHGRL